MFSSLFRMRILPFTMFAVFMLLAVKLADVARGGEEFTRLFLIRSVQAQGEDAPPPEAPKAPEAEKPSGEPSVDLPPAPPANPDAPPAAPGEQAAEGEAKKEEPPKEGEAKPAEAKPAEEKPAEGGEGEHGEKKKDELPTNVSTTPPPDEEGSGRGLTPGGRIFSPIELDILENLIRRRQTLDTWGHDVEAKENLLSNVEKRIDEKIVQIDQMKKELGDMIAQYNNEQDSKIKSLVKIYESMKPRDAARIFDEIEMPILLLVIDRMSEKKAAPILAAMEPKKAKQLTVELAEARRLESLRLRNAAAAAKNAAPAPAPKP